MVDLALVTLTCRLGVRLCQAVRMSLYGRPGACYIDLLAGCAFVSGCEDESVWSTWRLLH